MGNVLCDGYIDQDQRMRCRRVGCSNNWNILEDVPSCTFSKLNRPEDPAQILSRAAATFIERNALYGANYRQMGPLLLALFPNHTIPEIRTPEDAARLNLMIDILGKLQRYAFAFERGGHKDSAHDIMPYAAMLEEMTNERT